MRFSTIAHTVLALSALSNANPLGRRAYDYVVDKTVTKVHTIDVTVTPEQTPTQAPAPAQHPTKVVQHFHDSPVVSQETQQSSQAPAPAPVPASTLQVHQQPSSQAEAATSHSPVNHAGQQPGSVFATTIVQSPAPTPATPTAEKPKASLQPFKIAPSPKPETTHAETPASSPTSTANASNGYQKMVLDAHNIHRSNHSAPALQWDSNLESIALQIAKTCVYEHNTHVGGGHYGQNIGFGVEADHVDRMLTNMMYNDEMGFFAPYYGQADPQGDFKEYGHFTQIVWKDTTHVGCATFTCASLQNGGGTPNEPFTVCNYKPAGNIGGGWAKNVLKPLGHPMVTAN